MTLFSETDLHGSAEESELLSSNGNSTPPNK